MTDPRNIAHDKKVQQEKKHKGEDIAKDTSHVPQPGKKPHHEKHEVDAASETEQPSEPSQPSQASQASQPKGRHDSDSDAA